MAARHLYVMSVSIFFGIGKEEHNFGVSFFFASSFSSVVSSSFFAIDAHCTLWDSKHKNNKIFILISSLGYRFDW